MARYRSYRKNQVKSIVTGIISIALVLAMVAGLGVLFTRETVQVSPSKFSLGTIHSDGSYVKTSLGIYTKDFIECQGLVIEPDFEAKGTFQVFYYDSNKNFIGATEVLDATEGVYSKLDTFVLAKYCRIAITPVLEADETAEDEDEEVEELEIKFWQVYGYANDYKISVNRDQSTAWVRITIAEVSANHSWTFAEGETKISVSAEQDGMNAFEPVDVKKGQNIYVVHAVSSYDYSLNIIFVNKEGAQVGTTLSYTNDDFAVNGDMMILEGVVVPEGAVECYISHSIAADCIYYIG